MTHRPSLPGVTLCAVDCATPALALRALRLSRARCDFARTLLLTSHEVRDPEIEVVAIPHIGDIQSYSAFVQKRLVSFVTTPFVLVVQWDGYVLDGAMWEEGFLGYDYIGAPWWWEPEGRQVGNGGFSLRSRRLMEMLAGPGVAAAHPEDVAIGREWRPELERHGIRFPDVATARRFSVESTPDASPEPSFGFHGLFNFWRAVPAGELPGLLAAIPPSALPPKWGLALMQRYADRERWAEADAVRRRLEAQFGVAWLEERLAAEVGVVDGGAYRRAIAAMGGAGG